MGVANTVSPSDFAVVSTVDFHLVNISPPQTATFDELTAVSGGFQKALDG